MIIERYVDFFENVAAQLKCCNAAMNMKPKESETVKVSIMGLLQGWISVASLKMKKS